MNSLCPSFERCGACSLLDRSYPEQLERKRQAVFEAFRSRNVPVTVHPTCGMEDPFHYRNKVIANVSMRGGKIVYGFYQEYSHEIVYAPDCLLHDRNLNQTLNIIKEELDALKIKAWGYGGVLKHILLRAGVISGQIMVVFVTADDMFHGRKELVQRITARQSRIRTVVQNTNPRDTSVVLGDREKVLYGSGFIIDKLLGKSFKISPRSFYQINPFQTERLYAKAISLAGLTGRETVLDAYCGTGTIGICAASSAGRVVGVEINPDAVRDAISNSRANRVLNARFYCSDVRDFMVEMAGESDVLIIDPPRSGCDSSFLRSVKRMAPGRIVYVSCNPQTQARDVVSLLDRYDVSEAWPFDMFPQTDHVENVMLLSRVR